MSPEKTEELKKKFPLMFQNLRWGFECDDGWADLITQMCEKIEAITKDADYHPQIECIKAKLGALKVYLAPYTEELQDEIQIIIDAAELKSLKICERCGERGWVGGHDGWLSTECNKCFARPEMDTEF